MSVTRRQATALGAALAGGLLVGAAGCAPAKKAVTLVLKAPTLSFASSAVGGDVTSSGAFLQAAGDAFAKAYTDADITVKVVEYENTEENANTEDCFGGNDAVDVLFNDYFTMEAHVHSGHVVPLDDAISDELRADVPDVFWQRCQIAGKTYMMPFLYRQNVLVYNNEWFRKAGLDAYVSDGDTVASWSMEEWEQILATLRQTMPDTAYPLMMYAKNNQGDTHVCCYIRSQGSEFFDADKRFNLETEEGVAGLVWIKDCLDKGYMPANAADIDILTNYDLFQNGQLAIYMCNCVSEANFDDYGLVNFPTVDGGCNTNFLTGFQVWDNGDADKLAAAKAFVRYVYESDFIDYETVAIPCNTSVTEKHADFLQPLQKYIANADKGVDFTGGNPNWLGVRSVFHTHIQDLLNSTRTPEEVAHDLDEACNAQIEAGYEKSELHE